MHPPQYFLARHAHLCVTKHHCVILDVELDQYFCVEMAAFKALATFLDGCITAHHNSEQCELTDVAALVAQLSERGILTSERSFGKPIQPVTVALPRRPLPPPDRSGRLLHRLSLLPAFLFAAGISDHRLRRERLADILRRVEARRMRHRRENQFEYEVTADLVAAFEAFRPLYHRPYLCLFDSLALLEFLSYYGIYPAWIFGVKTEPFIAHCWLQEGDTVLNDSVAEVAGYTPVMAV